MRYTFEEEFRLNHPETVGETDRHFDLDNYKDWLEAQLTEARKQLALYSVSQQRELFKGFLEKVVEETYSGDLTWQTREEAKDLLKLFYSTYLIYGEDILS